jgi:ParB-like chromosome segregation protein Spo0J
MVGESELIQDKLSPFRSFINDIEWSKQEVRLGDIILADNIRPMDNGHIQALVGSIKESGLLYPPLGDYLEIDGVLKPRIIAGQHRYYALLRVYKYNLNAKIPVNFAHAKEDITEEQLESMNRWIEWQDEYITEYSQSGESVLDNSNLETVKISSNTEKIAKQYRFENSRISLTDFEELRVQLTENLQNKMTVKEDAHVINKLWEKYKKLDDRKNLSIKSFAELAGRSYTEVRNAIKYHEKLIDKVQELVDKELISYSLALLIAGLNGDDVNGSFFYSEQFQAANKISAEKNMSANEKKNYILRLLQDKELRKRMEKESYEVLPIFSGEALKALEIPPIISFQKTTDREANKAMQWFIKTIKLISLYPEPEKTKWTKAVKERICELGFSLEDFNKELKEMGIEL